MMADIGGQSAPVGGQVHSFNAPHVSVVPAAVQANYGQQKQLLASHFDNFMSKLERKHGIEARKKAGEYFASKLKLKGKPALQNESDVRAALASAAAAKGRLPKGVVDIGRMTQPDSAAREHEALHYLLHRVAGKHGMKGQQKLVDHLLTHVHPDDLEGLKALLSLRGYRQAAHSEEVLTHMRDVLTNPNDRAAIKHYIDQGDKQGGVYYKGRGLLARQYPTTPLKRLNLQRLKQTWKKIVAAAGKVTPDMFKEELAEKSVAPMAVETMGGNQAGLMLSQKKA